MGPILPTKYAQRWPKVSFIFRRTPPQKKFILRILTQNVLTSKVVLNLYINYWLFFRINGGI